MAEDDPAAPTVRPYRSPADAEATLAAYRAAVLVTAARDYTREQVEAWAGPPTGDLARWDAARARATTFVAEQVPGRVVGFADLLPDGLVDMLFVHPGAGGRGVARRLLAAVVEEARTAGLNELRTLASRTARPVFERAGFVVVAERPQNAVRGVVVPNVELRRTLPPR